MNSLCASRGIVATAASVPLAALAVAACGGASDTPLYRYTGDAKPGDTNGQRVTAFGAAWFAVAGAGQVVSRPASEPGGGSMY
jgi:Secreted repeat of unknown function